MKRTAFVVSQSLLLLLAPSPSQTWGHGGFGGHGGFHGGFHGRGFGHGFGFHGFGFRGPRVVIGLGPAFWWGSPYPESWYYPPAYYGYAASGVVIPPAYVEQDRPAPPAQGYWYYCQSARAYYPNVRTCREQWVQVPTTLRIGRTRSQLAAGPQLYHQLEQVPYALFRRRPAAVRQHVVQLVHDPLE